MSEYSSNTIDISESTKGKLIYHSLDTTGCSKWQAIDSNNAIDNLLNIGMAERGDCTFLSKWNRFLYIIIF